MKTKYNRIVATGLLALMIANFSSCGTITITNTKDTNSVVGSQVAGSNATTGSNHTVSSSVLKGGVWDAIKNNPYLDYWEVQSSSVEWQGVPLTFLAEKGLIYINEFGRIEVTDPKAAAIDYPFRAYVNVDEDTKGNDVYVLLQYTSGTIIHGKQNPDVYLATWMLKYELDDIDYQTLLKLDGDYRCRFFVQEMDKQYQPEVINESIVNYDLVSRIGSHVRNKSAWIDKEFPFVFISNVDYQNAIITYGALSDEGYRYWDVDIRNSPNWEWCINNKGMTEEECESKIEMKTVNTPLGPCLTTFTVDNYIGGITESESQELYKNSNKILDVSYINNNALDRQYIYSN